ncbi:MAG: transporter substrate-binding domain-containing protein [Gammaproteobacteria bacterium]|nr:transporter substrate-binding domain-containing protein [Gammaproteobacteria bacterium]
MKKITQMLLIACIAFFVFFYSSFISSQEINAQAVTSSHHNKGLPLRAGWEPWYPYKYLKIPSLQSSLTGLDVELLKLIAADANDSLLFQERPLADALNALKQGEIDIGMGATYSDERAQYVYYSKPYRYEENALFVLRAKDNQYPFSTVDALMDYIQKHHFRLGLKKGSLLADAKLNRFVKDTHNAKYIVPFANEAEGVKWLRDGEIDGFIVDRIAGSAIIWQAHADAEIMEHKLKMKTPIHFIFSKKTVSLETVQAFNEAIENNRNNTAYRNNFSWYIYPVIMMQATGKDWFKSLDILGAIFFSISGVLIAVSLNKSFLAALLFAILPCLTGGILRDAIFNNRPVEALESPQYLLLICSVVLVGYCMMTGFKKLMQLKRFKRKSKKITHVISDAHKIVKQLLVVCDALGLATLSVSGVMTSLMAKAEPLWLWGPFFAFLTASFGTIIRDIISKNERLEDVVGELNSEVGIIWSLFLSLALIFYATDIQPDLIRNLIVITITGVFVTRLLIHYLKVPNVYFR